MFNPEMKVVRFGSEDVIATSGATRSLQNGDQLRIFNFGDADVNNNYVSLNGGSQIHLLSSDPASVDSVLSALGATGDEKIWIGGTTTWLRTIFEKADSLKDEMALIITIVLTRNLGSGNLTY